MNRKDVPLPVLFQTTVRLVAGGAHDALESIEMEDDPIERRRALLKFLVWAQATLQKSLLIARWCRIRAAQCQAVRPPRVPGGLNRFARGVRC